MEFEYGKLRGKIRECYKTEQEFAVALGIGRASLSAKLNNSSDFTRAQMLRAAKLLGISSAAIPDYFFVEKVQKHERIS